MQVKIENFTSITIEDCFSVIKIIIYLIGMMIIIILGNILKLPDWDTRISIIMPTLTFLIAGITTGNLIKSYVEKKNICIYLLIWICFFELNVDLVYVYYNSYVGHMYFRIPNIIGSSILYLLCCAIFSYKKTDNIKI